MVNECGQKVLNVHIIKAIYGLLVSEMLFYRKLTPDLINNGFEINTCYPCLEKKQIEEVRWQLSGKWMISRLVIPLSRSTSTTAYVILVVLLQSINTKGKNLSPFCATVEAHWSPCINSPFIDGGLRQVLMCGICDGALSLPKYSCMTWLDSNQLLWCSYLNLVQVVLWVLVPSV